MLLIFYAGKKAADVNADADAGADADSGAGSEPGWSTTFCQVPLNRPTLTIKKPRPELTIVLPTKTDDCFFVAPELHSQSERLLHRPPHPHSHCPYPPPLPQLLVLYTLTPSRSAAAYNLRERLFCWSVLPLS